ncbi:MAG: T9SS type A sorting domain-containing protein [Bacteroidota bacterium]
MKNNFLRFGLTCGLLLGFQIMFAQIIVTEGFETAIANGGGTGQGDCACLTVPDQFSDGTNDYYGRQNNGGISANGGQDYAGFMGSNYFAGEDHDASDCNSPCTPTLCFTMDNLTVPNPTVARTYRVELLAGGNGTNGSYDSGDDFVNIEYSVDNQSTWIPLICFSWTIAGTFVLSEDSDCVEPGDGLKVLGQMMQTFVGEFSAINPVNDQVHIRVCANSNSGNEEWAVDQIVVSDDGFLPVELVTFNAKIQEEQVILKWETASEQNNEGFEIQRSADGKDWQAINWIDGHNTTSEHHLYRFQDQRPLKGLGYYRLKQMDFDGTFAYSPIVSVHWNNESEQTMRVAPNPTQGSITYQLYDDKRILDVDLYDAFGQRVKKTIHFNGQLSMEGLAPGIYLLVITTETGQLQELVVKQ